MNTKQIIEGIQEASCKAELSAHLDLVEQAIDSDACDFNASDSEYMELQMMLKSEEFNARTYH